MTEARVYGSPRTLQSWEPRCRTPFGERSTYPATASLIGLLPLARALLLRRVTITPLFEQYSTCLRPAQHCLYLMVLVTARRLKIAIRAANTPT